MRLAERLEHLLGEIADRDLLPLSDGEHASDGGVGARHSQERIDRVGHEREVPRRRERAELDPVARERLRDDRRDDRPRRLPRAVRVERTEDATGAKRESYESAILSAAIFDADRATAP